MNKIICDICGSTYPETAQCCPICGSSREFGIENPDYVPSKMPEYVPESKKKQGLFSSSAKKAQEFLYDMDESMFDAPMDILPEISKPDQAPAENLKPRTNYFLVVFLTFIIGLCLIFCGFLLFRYYIPYQIQKETPQQTEEMSLPEVTTEESTESTIPCKSIVLTSGVPEINRIGQYWLLHVLVMPEDTTDRLTFVSSDESVVTVTDEGRLCAVGEGQTTIVISCGSEQILCQVTVKLPEEETTGAAPSEETEAETDDPVIDQAEMEETKEEEPILKLVQSDISFNKKGVTFQLELDCDLDPSEVIWLTLDPDVAICHDGVITVLGNGITRIVAQYGDQEVYCVVRCNFQ